MTEAIHIRDDHKEQQSEANEKLTLTFGIIIPLIVYFIIGIISLMYNFIQLCSCYTRTCRDKECKWCKCAPKCKRRPHGSEWIDIIAKVCTICGSILYFLGDNFREVYKKDNAGAVSLGFSVFGVLLYRIVPVALKKLERYFKDKPHVQKSQMFNWCSPNNNETHSLIVAYTYLLTIVIDFDVWLTVILKKGDDNQDEMNSLCNRMHEVNLLWILYGGMMATFVGIVVIILTVFVISYSRPNVKKLHVILPTHKGATKVCIVLWEFILSLAVFVAVGMFLVADNQHLLDCYEILTDKDKDESLLRLLFFLVAFVIFVMITIGFFCRTLCCCVKVKGEIISVDVLQDDNQLKVYYKEESMICFKKTVIGTLKYKILTSEIIDSDSSHHELYKSDIERVVKCLAGIGKCVAVNIIQEDQIAVVHEIEKKIYIVMYNTSSPTECEVYTERVNNVKDQNTIGKYKSMGDTSCTSKPEERSELMKKPEQSTIQEIKHTLHVAMYYQGDCQTLCSVYLEKQGHERYYVVPIKQVLSDPNEKYATFNVQADNKVLRVSSNLSDITISKYDPEERCFKDESLEPSVHTDRNKEGVPLISV